MREKPLRLVLQCGGLVDVATLHAGGAAGPLSATIKPVAGKLTFRLRLPD
jgi:hypothetical protein